MKTEYTITGLSYHNLEEYLDVIDIGTILSLRRDTANKYDKNATGVFYKNSQIGWVPKAENAALASWVDSVLKYYKSLKYIPVIVTSVDIRDPYWTSKIVIKVEPDNYPLDTATKGIDLIDEYQQVINSTTIKNTQKENTLMDKLVNTNKIAAQNAAYNEASRIALNQLTKIAAKNAPLMIRGYLETPFGKLVLANLAVAAVGQFRPNDTKLAKLAVAAVAQAYQEVYQTFDIEKVINEFVDNAAIKKVLESEVSDLN